MLRGYIIATINVHAPGQHMWLSPGSGPHFRWVNTRSPLASFEKNKIIESTAICSQVSSLGQNHARDCFWSFALAVLYKWSLSRPFLGQVVNLDLLLCTGFNLKHAALFLCLYFDSENNEWLKDWSKWWALLWSVKPWGHSNFLSNQPILFRN